MKYGLLFGSILVVPVLFIESLNAQGTIWTKCLSPSSLGYLSQMIFDSQENLLIAGIPFLRSTDKGKTWTSSSNGISTGMIGPVAADKSGNYFMGTYAMGILRSTDYGNTWTPSNSGLTSMTIDGIQVTQNDILIAATYDGVFKSTNKGLTWNQIGLKQLRLYALAIIGSSIIFAGGDGTGILRTMDLGTTWTQMFTVDSTAVIQFMATSPQGNIYISTLANGKVKLYQSNDSGITWSENNIAATFNYRMAFDALGASYVSTSDGLYRSTNSGNTWTPFSKSGLNDLDLYSIAVSSDPTIFVLSRSGLYKASATVSIKRAINNVPFGFALSQNYPNPFNPTTQINFALSKFSYTTLEIFDLLGRRVSTLVAESLQPGIHKKSWDATGHRSGVYFYILHSGEGTAVRKLLLQK